jgi:hypothetical protein
MLWAVAVWSLFGGAITRMAALHLGRESKASYRSAMGHALAKWTKYWSSPLLPLLGIAMIAVPLAILGLLGRTNIGMFIVGLLWPVLLLGGVLMTIFAAGLWLGWPLMWAAISTESSDSFDALSRAYSYVFQRTLRLLGYVVVATFLSIVGGAIAWAFAAGVVHLTSWSVAWGAGNGPAELTAAGVWAQRLIFFWDGVARLLALGFVYSYFWTASTAIYLLLRRDVDGTALDEIYVDETDAGTMPPLATDPIGVPDIADEPLVNGHAEAASITSPGDGA